MQLGTLAAILGFALEREAAAAAFYERAAVADGSPLYRELAAGNGKRIRQLERARRESVSEMILEAIHGLDSDDFALPPDAFDAEVALAVEEASARYYRQAAEKVPIVEIGRLLQRLARENEARRDALRSRVQGHRTPSASNSTCL